jgi:hypothetical protein
MRRIIGISILVFASLIFIISAVSKFTFFLFRIRSTPFALEHWWGSDKGGSGDLYGITSLPQFRNISEAEKEYHAKPIKCNEKTDSYNIYGLADSYTEHIFENPKNFCGASKSDYTVYTAGTTPIYLDKTKKNIFVIECVERDVRTSLADTSHLLKAFSISKEKLDEPAPGESKHHFHFNFKIKNTDADYETNLWDYRVLRPLKELKSKMNFNWFNRTYPDAVLSPDGKYLLYKNTVDTSVTQCSYRPISDAEIKKLVTGFNKVYDHYKQAGFDEIYLSIIPNPTTILYPEYKGFKYNQLIPKLESEPSLKLKVFDSYQLFKNSPDKDKIYQHSDTHWTKFGRQLWLNEFNTVLSSSNK